MVVAAPILGTYRDQPIAAWLDESDGVRYKFVGIALENACGAVEFLGLHGNEILTSNGMIYRKEPA